jgi:hypothetical protein
MGWNMNMLASTAAAAAATRCKSSSAKELDIPW